MKKSLFFLLSYILIFAHISCSDELNITEIPTDRPDTPTVTEDIEIQDFIWKGLNFFYLWQEEVGFLSDNKFETDLEYVNFLKSSSNPDDFFEKLIYERNHVDKWSWIVDDYVELEKLFQGVSKSNGVDFGIGRIGSSNDLFGFVRYILPNSDASDKNIKRGDIFTHVNGKQLTVSNYREILFSDLDTYTVEIDRIENNNIVSTGVSVELTKFEYTENPVFITKTFNEDGHIIGYIMYNGFTSNFDDDLNLAFLKLKNEGITDLILDFRYNPGGSVRTAVSLASMITGQFKDQLFTKEEWNSKLQAEFENSNPDWLINNFTPFLANGKDINSLGLNKVHIIVTNRSASASELIINGLNPYIDVRLIGEQTVGKYVASITLYDSDNFGRNDANPNHTYAMQPIVLQELNAANENNKQGFIPQIQQSEVLANMGVLGEDDEPLLNRTISDITGRTPKLFASKNNLDYLFFTDTKMNSKLKDNMYVDKAELKKFLKNTLER